MKYHLFGPLLVSKEHIGIDDLDQYDQDTLASGYCMLLPGRDRAGRAVVIGIPKLRVGRRAISVVSESKVMDYHESMF